MLIAADLCAASSLFGLLRELPTPKRPEKRPPEGPLLILDAAAFPMSFDIAAAALSSPFLRADGGSIGAYPN